MTTEHTITEAARRRAVAALRKAQAESGPMDDATLIRVVETALLNPSMAAHVAAEALHRWNTAEHADNPRFIMQSPEASYLSIATLVLDIAEQYETEQAEAAQQAQQAWAPPWVTPVPPPPPGWPVAQAQTMPWVQAPRAAYVPPVPNWAPGDRVAWGEDSQHRGVVLVGPKLYCLVQHNAGGYDHVPVEELAYAPTESDQEDAPPVFEVGDAVEWDAPPWARGVRTGTVKQVHPTVVLVEVSPDDTTLVGITALRHRPTGPSPAELLAQARSALLDARNALRRLAEREGHQMRRTDARLAESVARECNDMIRAIPRPKCVAVGCQRLAIEDSGLCNLHAGVSVQVPPELYQDLRCEDVGDVKE